MSDHIDMEIIVPNIFFLLLDPSCILQGDGNYLVDSSCYYYYVCSKGLRTNGVCPNNQYFNNQSGVCQLTAPSYCIGK